jgi:hypothetical protein
MGNNKRKQRDNTQKPEEISEEMVATRAYLRWLDRGSPVGEAERDWFEARAELMGEAQAN